MSDQLKHTGLILHSFRNDLKRMLQWLMQEISCLEADPGNQAVKTSVRMWACTILFGAVRELSVTVSSQQEELVDAAKDYLVKILGDPIRMPDLINHIGLGRSRMFALFKSATGMSPNDYLLRLRIEKAQKLLEKSVPPSVTDVAFATGFSSCQYFDKVFRKYTGKTPVEYRQGSRSAEHVATQAKRIVEHLAARASKPASQTASKRTLTGAR